MARKTSARSTTPPDIAAPAAAAPAAKPRARKPPAKKTDATPQPRATTRKSAAPKKATSVSHATEPTDEEIRVRAYHRYLERGGGHGMDFEDWFEAKQDLLKLRR